MYESSIPYRTDISLKSLTAERDATMQACLALTRRTRRPLIFSYLTSLRLHRIETPQSLLDPTSLHVCVGAQESRSHIAGVTFHLWTPPIPYITVSRRVRFTQPVTAWFQMAQFTTDEELIILGDSLMRSTMTLKQTTVREISDQLALMPAFRGKERCRRVLPLLRENTDSPMETRLRLVLVRSGLPCPSVNVEIPDDQDRPMRVDMAYEDYHLALEYDGSQHFESTQHSRDIMKGVRMLRSGWTVIRVDIRLMRTPEGQELICEAVAQFLRTTRPK